MPNERIQTWVTTNNITPPRHRIMQTLDEHKERMPDQVYKSLAESIAVNGMAGLGMYNIRYIETRSVSLWDDDILTEGGWPVTEYGSPVMKEVVMPLNSFLFCVCGVSAHVADQDTKLYDEKDLFFPKVYHVGEVNEDMPTEHHVRVQKDVTLLSACKM